MDTIVTSSPELRGVVMFTAVAVVAAAEALWPKRAGVGATIRKRWPAHFVMAVANTFVIRFAAVGLALALAASGWRWGLLPALGVSGWAEIIVVYLALDVTRYATHRALHRVPVLWRFHAVHHVDQEFDFTTGLRFHPLEPAFVTLAAGVPIVLLGASPGAVLVNEIVLIFVSITSHANVRVPGGLDRWVRLVLTTPDLHRVHHSAEMDESNSNFGNTLTTWDRLFGTYRARPRAGHEGMTIGLHEFREPRHQNLGFSLIQPFLRTPAMSDVVPVEA